jgi:hypothetical protein
MDRDMRRRFIGVAILSVLAILLTLLIQWQAGVI